LLGFFNRPVGYEGAYFSLFAREEQALAALIVPALEIRRLETLGGGTWMPNIFAYSSPMDDEQLLADDTLKGQDYIGWLPQGKLEPLEERWLETVDHMGDQMSPNAFWALVRANK